MSDEVNDFFARKDKSKKKGSKSKKKFTTSSEIAQHVETQVQAQAERDYAVNAPAPVRPAKRTKEDEEWEDFAEEHTPDLSGLKIQSLSKMKQSQAEQATVAVEKGDCDDGSNSDSEKPSKPAVTAASNASSQAAGVWQTGGSDNEDGDVQTAQPTEASVAAPTQSESTAAAAAEAAPAAGAKYIPPSQRHAGGGQTMDTSTVNTPAAGTAGRYIPPSQRRAMEAAKSAPLQPMHMGPRRGRNTGAPDVNSDEAFPSLAAATGGAAPAMQRPVGFQDVHRGATAPTHNQRSAAVSVENRFGNLR